MIFKMSDHFLKMLYNCKSKILIKPFQTSKKLIQLLFLFYCEQLIRKSPHFSAVCLNRNHWFIVPFKAERKFLQGSTTHAMCSEIKIVPVCREHSVLPIFLISFL